MRKKLIEVALPLEAINAESAREKSIRHGHPSTLHLWWARRPLAACRAVLWASLVDDPSSWPDRFPTEEAQKRERQRLFDILGRFETETDKKGATKQVVRGLVSWDDIKEPEVINEAQREIARCLAWERGEEPPTQPDAVRDYIARYAPPAYDPFAGGGSIPLEAQRLGLEAHASDLNPVAVLINKALIEIPPRFKDQAPVNPVSRNELLGVRNEDGVQGFDRLAESYEGGDRRLSADAEVTEGRNLRNAFSNHAGCGLYSSQYSGGVDEGVGQGEGSLSGDRSGISSGGGDVTNAVRGSGVVPEGSDGSIAGVIGRSESNVNDVAAGEERSEGGEERSEGGEVRSEDGEVRNKTISSQLSPNSSLLIPQLSPNSSLLIPQLSPNSSLLTSHFYKGAQGLAADVRYYGEWMREEAFKRIGHLYPKVSSETGGTRSEERGVRNENAPSQLTPTNSSPNPSQLTPNTSLLTVIAWLWARTVTCPNPACGCRMPLVRSFQLSTKKGKEAWVEPVVEERKEKGDGSVDEVSPLTSHSSLLTPRIRFEVKTGKGKAPEGTVERKGAVCLACETPVPLDHVRSEGKAGRMGQQLMAIVAEGQGGRVYLSPTPEQEEIALSAQPDWKPNTKLPKEALGFRVQNYGMTEHAHLFTDRQLVALTTFSDLVSEAKEKAIQDAIATGLPDDDQPLAEGGQGARAYGEAIAVYLAFLIDQIANHQSTVCSWNSVNEQMRNVFARQAIPMTWDFAESNLFCESSGSLHNLFERMLKGIDSVGFQTSSGISFQHDAKEFYCNDLKPKIMSSDPPYYDAVPYADLSDFFYVWLRHSVGEIYPEIFGTLLVPKAQEMVADNFRHGSKAKAKEFFETGLTKVFHRVNTITHQNYPFTVYYALKQTESDSEDQIASTGWETILEGLMQANFSIGGTWPLKTEREARTRNIGSNALASSIVLVCRPRPANAPKTSRRQFIKELNDKLPRALKTLQQGNIAPVDLAQASIGPGMAIYSQYAAVLENDGSPLRVRTALQLINQLLDEFLTEQEGEFDSDTRWALTWFEQYQFNPGPYGEAELLSKARVTSVQGLVDAGILEAKAGKARLLPREEIGQKKGKREEGRGNSENSVPSSLSSIPSNAPHWFLTQVLIHALDKKGETGAADLLAKLGDQGEIARDLAYRLYNLCDRKGWTQEAISYNSLVISWPEISRLANESQPAPEQMSFL